jgi:hypothetical protein
VAARLVDGVGCDGSIGVARRLQRFAREALMRRWMVGMGLLALAGCASSTSIENQARIHTLRADAAARARQYDVAAREQEEAERLHLKAQKRAYKEGRSDVIVPAEVPGPTTPRGSNVVPIQ